MYPHNGPCLSSHPPRSGDQPAHLSPFLAPVRRGPPEGSIPKTMDFFSFSFIRLLFLHVHRESSDLVNELQKELDQFRFLHVDCLTNLKGSVGLNLTKVSTMRISIRERY